MKFEIISNKGYENVEEQYYMSDKSFDGNPSVSVDINLAIAYLNLGIDSEDMCVKCLWGFSPRDSWKEESLTIPPAQDGKLKLLGEYEPGLTWRLDINEMWSSYFDARTGWYCIGNPLSRKGDSAVRINRNMIVVIDSTNELTAIWVHPTFL